MWPWWRSVLRGRVLKNRLHFEHARTSEPKFTVRQRLQSSQQIHPRKPAATPAVTPHKPSAAEEAVAEFTPTNDPKEIVRRSMEIDRRTLELARNYTCQQREVVKHLDKNGNMKSTEVKTYDVGFYYGEEYSRLIMKDDKPLDYKEKKKEDEKLEKFLAKLRNQSPEDRQKRAEKEKKRTRGKPRLPPGRGQCLRLPHCGRRRTGRREHVGD